MSMNNPFNTPAYSTTSLSTAINILPNNYGLLGQLNILPGRSVRNRSIIVEERQGVLHLLPTAALGAPSTFATADKRKVRSFVIPHIPHDDVVLPEEVQDVRAFGQENAEVTIAGLMTDKLQAMRNKHAITLEYLRMGAIKGLILDADGSTIYNLYTEFGVTQKVINFALSTTTLDPKLACLEVVRYLEDTLRGETMTAPLVLVDEGFFDAFTSHVLVRTAYDRWMDGAALRNDMRGGFPYGGLMFREYRGTSTDRAGTVRKFIAADQGHVIPMGTQSTFATYFAPADFNEAANTMGLELYAKQEVRPMGRGWDIHTQCNPLPMCHRPDILVKLTMS